MRVYVELAKRGFRRHASYRAATVAGAFTNVVFGFFRASILLALYRHRPEVGGLDVADALTYAWLSQGLIMVVQMWGWNEVSLRVRSGDVAVDLCRPIDFQGLFFAQDMGRAAFHAVSRGVIPLAVGAFAYHLRFPDGPVAWLAFLLSVTLAVCVSFSMRFVAGLLSFWLVDSRGVRIIYSLLVNFLSGFIIPVAYFPEWLRTVAHLTPFPSVLQVPVDVFLGKVQGAELAGALLVQAAWALAILALGRRVLGAGVRRLVVQGG